MQSEPLVSISRVNQGFIPQQQPKAQPELNARLAAVLQLYTEVMKENEQLKELIKRGEEIAASESKNLKETLLARDQSIGALQVQVEQLKNQNETNKKNFERKESILEKEIKTQQTIISGLKKRESILMSAFETLTEIVQTPFCLEKTREAWKVLRARAAAAPSMYQPHVMLHHEQIFNHVINLTTCVNETNKKLINSKEK